MLTFRPLFLAFLLAAVAASAQAVPRLVDADAVPQLDARGKAGYRQFLAAPMPRAFAIAPGGGWGWSAGAVNADFAEREALANCQANTAQSCQLYARDGRVVFDDRAWVRALGPYKNAAEAAQASTGVQIGQRFPDLAFKDDRGRRVRVADLKGKVTVLHFWGSWCPPCKREMPDLAKAARLAKPVRDLRFVLLQVREDFASARAWARQVGRNLPLYDSGMSGGGDTHLKLADGGEIADRAIAMAFPTTYVLDKHGIVVFSHVGPLTGWEQYLPLLKDVASRSGK